MRATFDRSSIASRATNRSRRAPVAMKLVLPILVLLTCAAAGADPLALPGDPSKLSCSSSMPECDLVVVTEVAKAALEKLPDHERLQLRFSHSSNAQLA